MDKHVDLTPHILCVRCHENYREAIERWTSRRLATVTSGQTSCEVVCVACHGRLEAGESVVVVRWENGMANARQAPGQTA